MFSENANLDLLLRVSLLGPITVIWIVVLVRFFGLRTFSKMTAFDFIVTLATGSLLASAAGSTQWSEFLQAILSVMAILSTQAFLASIRRANPVVRALVENEPIVLMLDGHWQTNNMKQSRVDKTDIWAKLREANVLDRDSVRAVILETTGDISVLHGDHLSLELLNGIADKPGK